MGIGSAAVVWGEEERGEEREGGEEEPLLAGIGGLAAVGTGGGFGELEGDVADVAGEEDRGEGDEFLASCW